MTDVVHHTEGGRTFTVYGLGGRAAAISAAAADMDDILAGRVKAAEAALSEWRGSHATEFTNQVNDVLSRLATFRVSLGSAARTCSAWPHVTGGVAEMHYADSIYAGARVEGPVGTSTASADPTQLRAYATIATGHDARYPSLAATVTLDGCRAEVTTQRPLTAEERARLIDSGAAPQVVAAETIAHTEPYPVEALVSLPDLSGDARAVAAASAGTGEFATGVAIAFEQADQRLLDLLAEHPSLAAYVVPGGAEGAMDGESSLAVIAAFFADADIAHEGGDPDGEVSPDDLEAVAGDASLPDYLRDAAQHLLDSPTLFDLTAYNSDEGDRITTDGIALTLEFNDHLRAIKGHYAILDTAHEGGDPDSNVSRDDLEAAADDESLDADVRAAAQWLLDHDRQFDLLSTYEDGAEAGFELGQFAYDDGGFSELSVIGLLVDGQAFSGEPMEARAFVNSLPVADGGGEGLPIWLASDDGVRALANTALAETFGDLTTQQSVIAHLPETEGAVRNQLITAFYDMLAQRADGVFAGDLAGRPTVPGHPGVNWLIYAPWASNGVHEVINGDFSVMTVNPNMGQRQAAADGNQWIFNDITARFAAFVELYERSPHPSPEQLESFFRLNFDEGDAEIRNGFAAYAAAMTETDPLRRQQLMFQGNTLVATHEQAGAQPYLEGVGLGYVPDSFEAEFIDVQMGDHLIEVNKDLPALAGLNNLLVDVPVLDLDPGGDPPSYLPGVAFDDIAGIDGFNTSTATWFEEGGAAPNYVAVPGSHYPVNLPEHPDPDAVDDYGRLPGTAVTEWTDYDERMWNIHRLFEQTHTDETLYDTSEIRESLALDWLDVTLGSGS